jgi:hypothetical protein
MRNLKSFVNLKYSVAEDCQLLTVGSFDYNKNIFMKEGYDFFYKEGDILIMKPSDGTSKVLLSRKELNIEKSKSVGLFYNPVMNTLNLALEVGDVLSISLDQSSGLSVNEIQCVGSIGTGLQCAALSPDSETIVLLSGDNVVIVMSGHFDSIGEVDLFGSDQGEQTMVNVGWGKKETQFHGSEGKAAAKRAVVENDQEINIGEQMKEPKITWRGDSTLFAVNYWCPEKNQRKVKIFDKCGTLQCTSEFLPGE